MGLAEKLASRASARGATAQVDCGELGSVTVEALPVRELELLLRESDGQRAVFFAACRELQSAGEELRKAGKVFTPYGIMQFVSDSEAAAAARTILELNSRPLDPQLSSHGFQLDENRLSFVQQAEADFSEVRLASVQEEMDAQTPEVRPEIVQVREAANQGFGQDSHETQAENEEGWGILKRTEKALALGILPSERTQNVVDGGKKPAGGDGAPDISEAGLHEIKSESDRDLHEIKSEFRSGFQSRLHETESEFSEIWPYALHETESELPERLHETESELPERLHEMKSEFRQNEGFELHEIKSESPGSLHETESELAERTARRLLEGLQRAKWVRGG